METLAPTTDTRETSPAMIGYEIGRHTERLDTQRRTYLDTLIPDAVEAALTDEAQLARAHDETILARHADTALIDLVSAATPGLLIDLADLFTAIALGRSRSLAGAR